MESADRWFTAAPTAPATAAVRLFWFPFAGGNAAAVLPWQAALGPRVQLRVAQLPGRGARLFEPPPHDLDELVGHLADAVAGLTGTPYAFFGHSLGALVAFEVARALRRRDLPGPQVLWVAGAEGPGTRLVTHRLRDLPEDELVEALREYNGTPAELLADREMLELLLPSLRADFALDELYSYRPQPPLDVPVHLLRGDRDPYVDAGRAAGWARETVRPLRQHVYPGDHFFVDAHRAAIAELLAATLTGPLAAGPRPAP